MILGIDIGTSVTKAAVFDRTGRCLAQASQVSTLSRLPGGRIEQDLNEVIASVGKVAREVLAQLHDQEGPAGSANARGTIQAVALTAQGDGLWLRDKAGNSIRPPISWMDARASDIVRDWNRGGQNSVVQRVYELTGSGIFAGSQAGLLAHLSVSEPESLERAAVAGHCADAVLQHLTGQITVDAADASMPFLDVATRTYVEEALELCGIEQWRHLLAEPAPVGATFALNRSGAELLGLPTGTPVTGGPFDMVACAIGSGAFAEGDGSFILGTTLSAQVYTRDATIVPGSEPAGVMLCTPEEGLYLHSLPTMVGTESVEWMRGLFGFDLASLGSLLDQSAVGANGVRALSLLSPAGERAPFVDPLARGQFVNLTLGTTAPDLVRATCEAVAFASRQCFEILGLSGEISATGGGLKSRQWAQIFADVLGRPLNIPREELVGARGAALVAWGALGDPVDQDAWRADRTVIEPNPAAIAAYDDGFAHYLDDLAAARAQWNTTEHVKSSSQE
jgi:erythritol kinase